LKIPQIIFDPFGRTFGAITFVIRWKLRPLSRQRNEFGHWALDKCKKDSRAPTIAMVHCWASERSENQTQTKSRA